MAVSTLAVVIGTGNIHSVVDVLDGRTWLASSGKGEISLVNGAASKTEMRLKVGPDGKAVSVSQSSSHLLFTSEDGKVSALSLSDFTVSGSQSFEGGRDLQVVLGEGAAFVVNTKKGIVQAIDPSTASPIGSKLSVGGPLALGGIDDGDRLWAAATETGDLLPLTSAAKGARAGERMKVAEPDEVLHVSVVEGSPVVVNESRGLAAWVDDGKLGNAVRLRTDAGTKLAVPTESEDAVVPVAVASKNRVLLVRPGGVKAISLGSGKAKLGSPVRFSGRTYVPDVGAGEVVVVADSGKVLNRHPVPGGKKGFELFVDDTHVWANAVASNQAVSIDRRDQPHVIEKYDKEAILRDPDPQDDPTDPVTPPPVRPTNNPTAPPVTVPGSGTTPGAGPGPGAGTGGTTTTTTAVRPPASSVPAQPTGLSATAGNRKATVHFRAPKDNGSPITSYHVTWQQIPGGPKSTADPKASQIVSGGQGTYDIDDLKNGKTYRISVQAVNALGAGTAATTEVKPTGSVPTAPTSVNAEGQRDGTILVTWDEGDGEGHDVTGYAVEYAGARLVDPTADPNTDRSYSVDVAAIGVPLGQDAKFEVRTISSVGGAQVESPTATSSNRDSAFRPPGAPGTPTVTARSASQATLSWSGADSNGRDITEYRVLGPGDTVLATTNGQTSAPVSVASTVTVTVVAVNEGGQGSKSGAVSLSPSAAPTASVSGAGSYQNIVVSYNVIANGAALKSCTVSVEGVGAQNCSAGSGTLTFSVGAWGAARGITLSVVNEYDQSGGATGSASTWQVFNYQLAGDINIPVRFRTGPGSNTGVASRGHGAGTAVPIVCQTRGTTDRLDPGDPNSLTGNVWDRMADGTWVNDIFTNTPNARSSAPSPGIPAC
jgi:hypothetical protein